MDVIFYNAGPTFWNTDPTQLHEYEWVSMSRYIGPYKIAHWIRKHNHTCQVIDFVNSLSFDEIYSATKKFITKDTKILAVATTFLCGRFYDWPDGHNKRFPKPLIDALTEIKKEYPKLKFVLGGYGSDRVESLNLFDATIDSYTSSPEDIFLEYLEHYTKGTQLPLGHIKNSFDGLENKSRMIYDTARNKKYNIESDDFKFIKQDVILNGEALPLDVSRGCIFKCSYCQYPHLGKKKMDYIRSMSLIKEELLYNYNMFGTTNYNIVDDTFNDTEWKVSEFLKVTQSLPFKITYTAYLRADLIERFEDTALMMKESGLWGAFHGIETLHPYASKLIGKGWSGKKAKEFIPKLFHDIWKGEVPQQNAFIVGLPKETKEDIISSFDWFKQNNLYSMSLNPLRVYDYSAGKTGTFSIPSDMEKNPSKYGIEFDEHGWKNETWTQKQAFTLYRELYKKSDKLNGMPVFRLGDLLSLGYSKDYLLKTKLGELNWQEIKERNDLNFKKYYKQLMEL
jgi:radical SAM superfamily enzyme YgiQ (UPF0313 family)